MPWKVSHKFNHSSMDTKKPSTSEEVIRKPLFIIKEIDILVETEKDQNRLMELLHLKDALTSQ